MISIGSETAKTLDMTELTKTFASLKTWKGKTHFPSLKHRKCFINICYTMCETQYIVYWWPQRPGSGGANHLAPVLSNHIEDRGQLLHAGSML